VSCLILKATHYALILVCFGLFLLPDTASAQLPSPRSYLFVEVTDHDGRAVPAARVEVFSRSQNRATQIRNEVTDQKGEVNAMFLASWALVAYDLKVSKSGYLTSEHVLFDYPTSSQYIHYSREEFPAGPEKLTGSEHLLMKVVLSKIPTSAREQAMADVDERRRQLLLAAKRGDHVRLRELLQAGAKPNDTDAQGVPAIMWAAFVGNSEAIKALLAAGANVQNRKTTAHEALLIYLVQGIYRDQHYKTYGEVQSKEDLLEQQNEIVRTLIEAGANVNVEHSPWGTVLNGALGLVPGDLSIKTIKLLVASGANVNGIDRAGMTALMRATQAHSLEAINLLLEAGARASINLADQLGNTAAMYACRYSYSYSNSGEPANILLKALVSAGADITMVNHDGQNALMLASRSSTWESVSYLIESGARPLINARDKNGWTALIYASNPEFYSNSFGPRITEILIQNGAKVNEKDNEGMTALMHSSKLPNTRSAETARILIDAGASVDEKDAHGRTALMYAAPRYYNASASATVKTLIERKANVNEVNDEGRTALMIASRWYDEENVTLLLAAGASPNARDKQGQTALMLACQSMPPIRVELYVKAGAGASINAKDVRGWTALMYDVRRVYAAEESAVMIAAGANVNEVNEEGKTALMLAAETGSLEIVRTLIDAGATIDARDKQGRTALMWALFNREKKLERVQLLLRAGADTGAKDNRGYTASMIAEEVGETGIAKILEEAMRPGFKIDR
jgi:ankyrin repeat protein